MNNQTTLLLGLCCLLATVLGAQGSIVTGNANFITTLGAYVKVEGGVSNNNNSLIDNEGSITLRKDWIQTGLSNYSGVGWIIFKGNVGEYIGSNTPMTIGKVQVDNGDILYLQSDIDVSQTVDLTYNGNIKLGNNNLSTQSNAVIIREDANHYIITNGNGRLYRPVPNTAVRFPVGNSTYNPAILTNQGTADVFGIKVRDEILLDGTTGSNIVSEVVDRTWDINEQLVGGSNLEMTLEWVSVQELSLFDRARAGVIHYEFSQWNRPYAFGPANSLGASRYQSTATGVNSFSPFGISNPIILLAAELMEFQATRKNADEVLLHWITANETDNKGFELERMFEEESTFTTIGFIEAQGASNSTNYYDKVDPNSYTGTTYYRLKQLNVDGTHQYSPVRAVKGNTTIALAIQAYPNPTVDVLYIKFPALEQENKTGQLTLTDVQGRLLHQETLQANSYQRHSIQEVANFLPGTYFLRVDLENGQHLTKEFIKQ